MYVSLPLTPVPSSSHIQLTFHLHYRRVNITEGEPIRRSMTTGEHLVRDINCAKCGELLGWKYGELLLLHHFLGVKD